MKYGYGWKADQPDFRDFTYTAVTKKVNLPLAVNLRVKCPPVLDQGQLGSCTANAIAGIHRFCQMVQKETVFPPSRLFVYYNERALEGTVSSDSGAQIRDGFKTINQKGVCSEVLWPYNIAKFKTKPPVACYSDGMKHQTLQYSSLSQTEAALKGCLADGFPVVFGFSVYNSFESNTVAKTGIVPMPKKGEALLGGHAVLLVGYNDTQWIVMNSWGTGWGDKGYCYFPKAYLLNSGLASDFWTIRLIE